MGPRTSEVTRSRVVRRRGLDERAPHVKSVARRCAPMASSPRILKRQTGTVQTLKICKKSLSPVAGHLRSACSGVKALRNTSDARRQAAKLC